MEILERFHLTPNIRLTAVEHNATFAYVEQGVGITITNELITRGRIRSAVLRPFIPRQYLTEGVAIHPKVKLNKTEKLLLADIEEYWGGLKAPSY